ncbi:MAG: hypothetical protein ACOH1J_06295 [Microbacteriaceae bacterium]
MKWWLRARGLYVCLGAGLALTFFAVLMPVLSFRFPTLFAGGQLASTHLVNVLAVIPVLVWIWGIDRSRDEFEFTAVRRDWIALLDVCAPLILTLLTTLAALLSAVPDAIVLSRNLIGLFGLGLLSVSIAPRGYAFLAPAGYVIVAMLAGYQQFQVGPSLWASVLLVEPDEEATCLALVVLGIGLVAYLSVVFRRRIRR